uniref:Aspartate peptidase n=1 Tax=uncultured bacterium Contigcl_1769 TaxID=1393659 RepID=W0FMI6_9BACT|nr:aspartate peptidase [uncultured bacterium Contigcl_1769]
MIEYLAGHSSAAYAAIGTAALAGAAAGLLVDRWCRRYLRGFDDGNRSDGRENAAHPAIAPLTCAVAFAVIAAARGPDVEFLELAAFACTLAFVTLTDLERRVIPNACLAAAVAVRAAYLGAGFAMDAIGVDEIGYYAFSAIATGTALLAATMAADAFFGRESMGGGDLKLLSVAGLYFGWVDTLYIIFLSCLFALAVTGIAFARERLRPREGDPNPGHTMQRAIPFGPAITLACILAIMFPIL